jgi:hypothetical protein
LEENETRETNEMWQFMALYKFDERKCNEIGWDMLVREQVARLRRQYSYLYKKSGKGKRFVTWLGRVVEKTSGSGR